MISTKTTSRRELHPSRSLSRILLQVYAKTMIKSKKIVYEKKNSCVRLGCWFVDDFVRPLIRHVDDRWYYTSAIHIFETADAANVFTTWLVVRCRRLSCTCRCLEYLRTLASNCTDLHPSNWRWGWCPIRIYQLSDVID